MSSVKDEIAHEVSTLPEGYAQEVLDFVRFLKLRRTEGIENALMTEKVLARDWDDPQEDEAWADL